MLANGDLTTEISIDFPPAYLRAKDNFGSAVSNLRHMIQRVVENADSIRTGTDEIAAASEDLARRTESNAAKAVEAMGRVSVSAKGIDSVIEGVDKIAVETRVLAVNAAVEAGRAGDAGRGFAVVADLVSALAMRAEEEAKRARDQLTVTQSEIVSAFMPVHKVDTALAEISGDVDAVHDLLKVIAGDDAAQSLAVTEISASTASMDRATQQNAAMVEETSAATRTLTAEVAELATAANTFKFERRTQSITPLVERRNARGKLSAAKQAAPRLAARRATPASRLAVVSSNGASDWDDF